MSSEKRKQAEKRKADARKKELRRYGYTGFETMTDRKINRLINRPSSVGKATEYAMNVGNYGPNSFIGQLEREGIKPPQALLDVVREKENEKQRRRDKEEEERKRRRKDNTDAIGQRLGIPQIHVEFIRNEFSPRNIYDYENSFESMKKQLIDYTISQLDYHNDINFTDEHGNFVSYIWGSSARSNNPVKSEMLRKVHALDGSGVVWLYNMMRNGTYFTDDINYDSDGDGKHTKHLFTAHQLLEEALNLPDDGVHDKYGDMMPDGYRNLLTSANSDAFKLYRELASLELNKNMSDNNKKRRIKDINEKAKKLETVEFELFRQLKGRLYDSVFDQ